MVKRFTLMIGAAMLMAIPLMAGKITPQEIGQIKKMQTEKLDRIIKHEAAGNSKVLRGPRKEMAVTNVIESVEGTRKVYNKIAVGYDYGEYYDASDMASVIVFGDNNDVYFQDILSGIGYGTYVKGELNEGVITVDLPQTIYYDDLSGYGINIVLLRVTEEGDLEIPEENSATFTYDAESGEIEMEMPGEPEEYMLGALFTDDYSWVGYGDFYQDYTPIEDGVFEIPAGLETEDWVFVNGSSAHFVTIAFDDDILYLKGLSEYAPDGIIVVNVDGNKGTITQDQIAGTYYFYFLYTKCFEYLSDEDTIDLAPADVVYEINIDKENKIITNTTEDYYLGLNGSLEYMMYLEFYETLKIYYQASFTGTPVNPYDLDLYDYTDYYGSYDFDFTIPNISTDGNMLNPDNLYYRIYVDGDLMEFTEDDYPTVDGSMTEIPYNFMDGMDFYSYWGGSSRTVALYFEGFTELGVQSVYIYDGETTESDIITLNVETGDITSSGIESVKTGDVVKTTVYDLNGRQVNNADKGIYILRQTLSDGNTVTRKVVRR